MITIICAWCQCFLGSYPSPDGKDDTTHGICSDCLAKQKQEIEDYKNSKR